MGTACCREYPTDADLEQFQSQHSSSSNGQWDPQAFLTRLQSAKGWGNTSEVKLLLRTVAADNHRLVKSSLARDMERTYMVTQRDVKRRAPGYISQRPVYSMSAMGTGDALVSFSRALKRRGAVVCGLNFANGSHPGGGYLHGAQAQEEELCRQFPALASSLFRAQDRGDTYPFGPCTYNGGNDTRRYADVLFTPRLVARRAGQAAGYRLLDADEVEENIALVSAAAPNVKAGELFEPELVKQAMRTILIAPRLRDRRIDTIVLGAWGCGAFGCDPRQIARLVADVLAQENFGCLYKEVHFAIPVGDDNNAQVFEEILSSNRVGLVHAQPGSTEMDATGQSSCVVS